MPVWIVWLVGALGPMLVSIAGRILFLLGFAAVTFTGFTVLLSALKSQLISNWGAMPSGMIQVAGLLRLDQAVLIVFSAYAAKIAIIAVDGAVTKVINRGPQAA